MNTESFNYYFYFYNLNGQNINDQLLTLSLFYLVTEKYLNQKDAHKPQLFKIQWFLLASGN